MARRDDRDRERGIPAGNPAARRRTVSASRIRSKQEAAALEPESAAREGHASQVQPVEDATEHFHAQNTASPDEDGAVFVDTDAHAHTVSP